MQSEGTNSNPTLFAARAATAAPPLSLAQREAVDAAEVFELIRGIEDPEHAHSLEELNVLALEDVRVDAAAERVEVAFAPTVPNCSSAALIGLMIAFRLHCCLHSAFRVRVRIKEGTHNLEEAINRQLGDKERVAAALENEGIARAINAKLRCADRPMSAAVVLE